MNTEPRVYLNELVLYPDWRAAQSNAPSDDQVDRARRALVREMTMQAYEAGDVLVAPRVDRDDGVLRFRAVGYSREFVSALISEWRERTWL